MVPYSDEFEDRVVELIVSIQRGEFAIDITEEQQPDLRSIPAYYQVGDGGFWLALSGESVVGTIALLDIDDGQAALRKMFVHPDFRGSEHRTAKRLLDELLDWATQRGLREILLGTTPFFHAAHRFYEKNGFREISKSALPASFPIMTVDTKFYALRVE